MRSLLLLLLTLPLSLLAQEDSASYKDWLEGKSFDDGTSVDIYRGGRHFLSAGAGMLTPDFLLDGYHAGKPVTRDYENLSPRMVYFVNYKYRVGESIFLGVTTTYEQQYGNWLDNQVYDYYNLTTINKGEFVRNCFTAAGEFSVDYKKDGRARIYFLCGVGVTYSFETDQYLPDYYIQHYRNGVNDLGPIRRTISWHHFNGQISPFCFKVGGKVCFFMEAGFGYKGVISGGLSYRFDQKMNK